LTVALFGQRMVGHHAGDVADVDLLVAIDDLAPARALTAATAAALLLLGDREGLGAGHAAGRQGIEQVKADHGQDELRHRPIVHA